MNNAKMYPFERNHYFYGKLLSVEDFELEQKYMNDKRRLINRFLYGSGVVTGLTVIDVDEQTVSLEAGFALDCWGREIVVDELDVEMRGVLHLEGGLGNAFLDQAYNLSLAGVF